LLVIAQQQSAIVGHFAQVDDPGIRVVGFRDRLNHVADEVATTLAAWLADPPPSPHSTPLLAGMSGPALAGELATLLDEVSCAYV
jgi:hypothetical protein